MRIDSASGSDIAAVRAAMGTIVKTTPREISPQETDIPPGWPRPYYRGKDGKAKYAQWSSGKAVEQIGVCSDSRTWTASKFFACTSCAQIMDRGLFLDLDWMNDDLDVNFPEGIDFGNESLHLSTVLCGYDSYDTHYGGAICRRCLVFALKACPFFSRMMTAHGDRMVMVEVRNAYDYTEWCESSAMKLTAQGAVRDRIAVAEIKERVRRGELYLSDRSAADVEEPRPRIMNEWDFKENLTWNPIEEDD